jgi:hypothetical protein
MEGANKEIKQRLIQCVKVANKLQPLMANGKHLRAIPVEGMDSKFLENNEGVLTALLNKKIMIYIKEKISGKYWAQA